MKMKAFGVIKAESCEFVPKVEGARNTNASQKRGYKKI